MKAKGTFLFFIFVIFCWIIAACTSQKVDDNIEFKELYRIQVGGKCGFINEHGQLVIEPQFDRAYWEFGDSACYAVVGERKVLINTNGDFIADLDTSINWVFIFKNNVAVFRANDGNEGVINRFGDFIVPAVYKSVKRDGDNGFIVEDTLGNMGYVNNLGELIVPCKYDAVNGLNEGLMVVATSEKCGYVDSAGTWILDSIYDDARAFGDGLARVKINGEWKFIDHKGKVVDRFNYDEILTGFTCNRAFVKKDNLIRLIDKTGRTVAEVNADSVYGFHDGYATVKRGERYGKIDTTGNVVINPQFENIEQTHDGLSVFVKNKKKGIIDSLGNLIVEAVYEDIFINDDYSLIMCVDNNWSIGAYYDRKGNLIWKDMQGAQFIWPEKPTKSDFVAYFDSHISELDPIEGIYYVTFELLAVDRNNDHASSNGSSSHFYAVMREQKTDDFSVYDVENPGKGWVKKFVKIGESNAYAVVNVNDDYSWAEDGKIILEDPYKFEFSLRHGGNSYFNWYNRCEFIKDYPSSEIYEQIQRAEWSGTGFAIADGYVVTNYHVTNGAKTINIKGIDGRIKESYKGYVVATDIEHDLAIIKIVDKKFDGFNELPYSIGKTIPEVGDEVFVLGYPMTDTMGDDIKLTDGIISAASGYKGDQSMYQISAAVQPGNSGGPLFDNDGNVIGIVCAKHADAENANYAIKASYLLSLINKSDLGIKLPDSNKVKSKSLSKKVKQVKPFVYIIECNSH